MTLSVKKRLAFGVGHVLNDLCASMWFSYLLLFFHKVLEFSNATAGYILLAGQIADGIATPLVGYESDRSGNRLKYGRRKTWHLIGTISVALSFPPLFMRCIGCNEYTPEYAQFVYYVPLVVIFQSGWAATQINHLALIPELARSSADKINLNAIRYAFTVLSNILVYVVTWLVFDYSGGTEKLSPDDIPEFRNIVVIIVAVGVVFSFLFHLGVTENPVRQRLVSPSEINNGESSAEKTTAAGGNSIEAGNSPDEKTPLLRSTNESVRAPANTPMLKWSDWFKRPIFYQMALLYMSTRLVVNLSQVYLPMYLTDTLKLPKNFIAIVPLVVYVSGFFATVLTNPLSKYLKNEIIYLMGAALVLGACTWSHFLDADSAIAKRNIFFVAVLLGLGSTIVLVMCLSMLSEMVGENTETGAFVYGSMSLTDKISNGVAIAVIQNLNPCVCNCSRCAVFFRNVFGWTIDAIMLIGVLIVLSHICTTRKAYSHEEISSKSDDRSTINA